MNKSDALAMIRKAKSAHIKWRSFAQALIAGVEVTDDKLPKLHTECEFGRWYHGPGQEGLGHLDSFKAIEAPHEMLHAIYARIYNALHGKEGLWSKLFTSDAERCHRKLELARTSMQELIGVSETLLRSIEILESEIQRWPAHTQDRSGPPPGDATPASADR